MRPRDFRNHSQRLLGGLRALLERSGGDFGVSMDGSRALQGAPGVLGGVFLEALEVSRGAFWMIFLVLGGTGSENGEKLENDDPLHEFVVLSRPKGLQNEIQIDPETIKREQWTERGPKS